MSDLPATHDPSESSRLKTWWLGQATLLLLLWLSLIKLPDLPSNALDTSWRMVIAYASDQRLQFGTDIAFTYGPLGYLLSYVYIGRLFAAYWVWQLVGNALVAIGLWRFGTLLSPWRRTGYYAYLFCIGSIFPDSMLMNLMLIFGASLVRPEFQHRFWLGTIGGLFAIFSLMKFTNLFLCGFILTAAIGYFLWRGLKRESLVLAGTFALTFFLCWIAHGQSLWALPSFFKRGLEVSLGYPGAMGVDPAPLTFWLGLSAALFTVGYLLLYFLSAADRRKAAYVTAVVGAIGFMNWKHGFIRADGHVLAHFMSVMMIACSYPALTWDSDRLTTAKTGLLSLAFGASAWGILFFIPPVITLAADRWNIRVREVATTLANFTERRAGLEIALKTSIQNSAIKHIPDYVAGERVTHLGDDQGFSLLNQLNFAPMPTIQSYTSYTPALNRLDLDFLTSPAGPRYVIQRYRALGSRLPALEDSLTQKLLYQTYYYVMEVGGLILWERPAADEAVRPGPEQTLVSKRVHFDEAIPLPDSDGRPIWAEVHIAPTLLGRVRQFFYKPPALEFEVEYLEGQKEHYQFVKAMGDAGFILSPLFRNDKDLVAYQTQKWERPIKQFSLHHPGSSGWFWKKEIEIVLRSTAPFQRASSGLSPATPKRFRMTNQAPVALEALVPPAEIYQEGQHLLHMHAPSRMEFTVPAQGLSSVSAQFGLLPSSYTAPNTTDGVEFSITWITADGRSEELYDRFLNPRQVATDRGSQNLLVSSRVIKGGKLVFRTLPGPAGSSAFDWAYWTKIELR